MEHDMQPARIKPHAKEHTNNPVQRPNFRGHAAGDGEVTRAWGSQMAAPTGKGTPTDDHSRGPESSVCKISTELWSYGAVY